MRICSRWLSQKTTYRSDMLQLNDLAQEKLCQFQQEDAEFVVKVGSAVLGHPTGMGKTLIALRIWELLRARRVLVLGGKSSASTWTNQPKKWAGYDMDFIAEPGSWDRALTAPVGAWHTTYDNFRNCMKTVPKWKTPHWDLVIADEAHRLRSHKTQWFQQTRRARWDHLVPMSATWSSRGPQDLWATLYLMDRKQFASYWRFVHTYCFVEENEGFGTNIYGIRNKTELQALLNGRYRRSRTWPEIGKQMPPLRREPVYVEMPQAMRRVYEQLDNELFAEVGGELVIAPTQLAKQVRLHQLATLPGMLFPSLGNGPILDNILDSVDDDPHTVIYTYFTEAIPYIAQALKDRGHQNVFKLVGGTPQKVVDQVIGEWKRTKGIIVISVRFAESFRVDTSHSAYFLSFSWDPNDNIQAEGRLRAIDSELEEAAIAKYYIVRNTICEVVQDVDNQKHRTTSQIFDDYAAMKGRAHGNRPE